MYVLVRVLYRELPLILGLLDARLGIYGGEGDVLVLWVEGEQWNCPVTSLIVPPGLIVQLVQLVLREKNVHYLVAELNCLLLATDDV